MAPDTLVSLGIGTLALAVAAASLWLLRATPRTWAGVAGWLGLTAALAAAGVFERFTPPPPLMIAVAVAAAAVVSAARSADPLDRPVRWLVALQAFRLPLELVMHHAATHGIMPVQMSFSGWNFDILTGLGALALTLWPAPPRWALRAWNVAGACLLAAIVVIAILSTPTFARFGDAPEVLNTWVAQPPYIWLPTVLVPAALLGHLWIARALRASPD
jgi:hypothetical protein